VLVPIDLCQLVMAWCKSETKVAKLIVSGSCRVDAKPIHVLGLRNGAAVGDCSGTQDSFGKCSPHVALAERSTSLARRRWHPNCKLSGIAASSACALFGAFFILVSMSLLPLLWRSPAPMLGPG